MKTPALRGFFLVPVVVQGGGGGEKSPLVRTGWVVDEGVPEKAERCTGGAECCCAPTGLTVRLRWALRQSPVAEQGHKFGVLGPGLSDDRTG